MPRYFFDIKGEAIVPDRFGMDFPDHVAAEDHAIGLSEAMLRKRRHSESVELWDVTIRDKDGVMGTVKSSAF